MSEKIHHLNFCFEIKTKRVSFADFDFAKLPQLNLPVSLNFISGP